ncbi:MAG: rRNA maturation RNase YbeY [Pseudomonadota bacterium]
MDTPLPDVQYCSTYPVELPGVNEFTDWSQNLWETLREETTVGSKSFLVRLVDHDEMLALNDRWRGKNAVTNVLAFPFDSSVNTPHIPLGDIVICVPVVAEEAASQGKTFVDRLAHLFVHGLLHLLGYDHQSQSDAKVMERIEREVLETLGYAKPYEAEEPREIGTTQG